MLKFRKDLGKKAKKGLENLAVGIVKVAGNVGLNLGGLAAIKVGVDQLDKLEFSDTTQGIAFGLGAILLYELNRSGSINKASKAISELKGKAAPYIQAGALSAMIGIFGGYVSPEVKIAGKEVSDIVKGKSSKNYEPKSISGNLPSIHTVEGMFYRTYRWDEVISDAEKKEKIEDDLLAGLIMRESGGNPLRLNSSNDGGAGLAMFQPGTGQAYGLDTYGFSKTMGRDTKHGKKLRALVKDHNWDYDELRGLDERFDVQKSVYAAADFLGDLYNKYGTWDRAVSAYNRGAPAGNPKSTQHVKKVRKFQNEYNRREKAMGRKVKIPSRN